MAYYLIKVFIIALGFLVASDIVPGIHVEGLGVAVVAALLWTTIFAALRFGSTLVTFPIMVFTLGLSSLAINAFLLWVLSGILPGYDIAGFWAAFLGAVILALADWLASAVLMRL